MVGLVRVRSPLLTESRLISFPPVTEMFHFTGCREFFLISPCGYFRKKHYVLQHNRLPHSEIAGSKGVCPSPTLIAAYHVLHRLLAPRHPLCALTCFVNFSSFKSKILTMSKSFTFRVHHEALLHASLFIFVWRFYYLSRRHTVASVKLLPH